MGRLSHVASDAEVAATSALPLEESWLERVWYAATAAAGRKIEPDAYPQMYTAAAPWDMDYVLFLGQQGRKREQTSNIEMLFFADPKQALITATQRTLTSEDAVKGIWYLGDSRPRPLGALTLTFTPPLEPTLPTPPLDPMRARSTANHILSQIGLGPGEDTLPLPLEGEGRYLLLARIDAYARAQLHPQAADISNALGAFLTSSRYALTAMYDLAEDGRPLNVKVAISAELEGLAVHADYVCESAYLPFEAPLGYAAS